jgi:glycosyltransferase involved in cell wall biosynthesis
MKVIIIENGYNDLITSRVGLGDFLEKSGKEVVYACPNPDDNRIKHIPMNRSSLDFFKLLLGYSELRFLEAQTKSDAVLSFRLIPNVLNYLSSFRGVRRKRVAVITGLGYAFSNNSSLYFNKLQYWLIRSFYRFASKRIQIVTQNPDDLIELGIKNGKVILGSGVIPQNSAGSANFDPGSLKLLYSGRLLKSKGVLMVLEIFEELKTKHPNASLTITGSIDSENPDSLSQVDLNILKGKAGINYLGFVKDMNSIYSKCNVLIFPSIYREGVPRVIVESLMHGLTIVTRNMPGCKETVKNNGFLITEKHSIRDIVEYLERLDLNEFSKNSIESKEIFRKFFSSEVIYPQYLELLV